MRIRGGGSGGTGWDVVRDEGGLERLAPEWAALNARCGPEGFFSRLEIVRANWDRHRSDTGAALHVVAIRDSGRLVMALPMVKRGDVFGTHALHWLDSMTPFYDGLLLDPDIDPAAAAGLFTRYLRSSWTRRFLKIGFVHEGSALHRVLDAAGLPLVHRTAAPSLDVSATPTWDAYLAAMPAKRRQQFGNYSRRLRKAGAGPVRLVTDPLERRVEIARLFARKRRWVKEQGLAHRIVPADGEAWFQRLAAAEDERNRTHVLWLGSADDWIASILAFERDGTLYLSNMAHNPEWERFSPGWILLVETIRFAIGRELSGVDFMIGSSAWKARLADRTGATFTCRANLLPWQRSGRRI